MICPFCNEDVDYCPCLCEHGYGLWGYTAPDCPVPGCVERDPEERYDPTAVEQW